MTKDEEQQLYDSPIRVPRAEWGTLYEEDYADIDKEMQELVQRFGPLDQTTWQRMRDRLIREHRIMETYLNAGADPQGPRLQGGGSSDQHQPRRGAEGVARAVGTGLALQQEGASAPRGIGAGGGSRGWQ